MALLREGVRSAEQRPVRSFPPGGRGLIFMAFWRARTMRVSLGRLTFAEILKDQGAVQMQVRLRPDVLYAFTAVGPQAVEAQTIEGGIDFGDQSGP